MAKRIDQLTAHPSSLTQPLASPSGTQNAFLAVRDASLPSDNTRKVSIDRFQAPHTVNVLDFGAQSPGDDSFDSTAAFQAALDWVQNNWGNGTVYVPQGVFCLRQIRMHEGISLIGNGTKSTMLRQFDGVNDDMIVQDAATLAANYIHGCRIMNFRMQKWHSLTGDGSRTPTFFDRQGSAIWFNSMCGEGTKFQNLIIEGFPDDGIAINGAVTCWMQDISVSSNGQYGIWCINGGGRSFTGHYMLGISGDNNGWRNPTNTQASPDVGIEANATIDEQDFYQGNALIGSMNANLHIVGVKSEGQSFQNYAVQMKNSTSLPNWIILEQVTHTTNGGFNPGFGREAIVNLMAGGAPTLTVMVKGISLHSGATPPKYVVKDSQTGVKIDYLPSVNGNSGFSKYDEAVYSRDAAGLVRAVLCDGGSWTKTASDPPVDVVAATHKTFGIGHTNGVGNSTSANLTALQKGTATNAPASLVVNKWVYATLDGVTGWIPFFV